jgi:hypothetical protein
MFILIMMLLLLLLPGLARDVDTSAQLSGTWATTDRPWEIENIEGVEYTVIDFNISFEAV